MPEYINKQFVIYLGQENVVTISNEDLSKVYRLPKGQPVLVENEADKSILVGWKELKKTSCCGHSRSTMPVYDDISYCKLTRKDLYQFRAEWYEKTKNQQS